MVCSWVYVFGFRGMLHRDKGVLGMILCRIYLKGAEKSAADSLDKEFQVLLTGKEGRDEGTTAATRAKHGCALLARHFDAFRDCASALSSEEKWLQSPNAEESVPKLWSDGGGEVMTAERKAMYELMCVYALRPDRFTAASQRFVTSVMGAAFSATSPALNLAPAVVEKEVRCGTPLLMCSAPGFDASDRVSDLAAQCGRPVSAIAIGSAEGFLQAEKAINTSSKSGRWVLLKNVHLTPGWLVSLEKKLHSIQAHPAFRLFLTCEVTPKIPVNLLRAGRIFTFEPPPGIKVGEE